jgi:hypothetical protein
MRIPGVATHAKLQTGSTFSAVFRHHARPRNHDAPRAEHIEMSRILNGLFALAIAASLTACGHSSSAPVDTSYRESNGSSLVLETSKLSREELPTIVVSAKRG